ncbi:MAG: S-methyl-5'-thioadenosine phosphorylase [Akkermansiaceae bacterium]
MDKNKTAAIGIIGGSGLYEMSGFEKNEELWLDTPFGKPSDALIGGEMAGRQVWFLPRHGRGHKILPHEINHRANIWALRSMGVRWLLCVTAVGSLKEEYAPRDILLPDQYFDRTSRREHHTFFGNGIVAHVGFGDPVSAGLRDILKHASIAQGCKVHDGGTYVNMDGPAFSTRAESMANRQLGFDVVGMTNLPEAKLAREAEIALATMCMITDYDCWHEEEEDVTVDAVIANLHANAANAQEIIARAIEKIPTEPNWTEHEALSMAIMTPKEYWPEATTENLRPLIEKYL